MSKHLIYGIHLNDRMTEASSIQQLLSEYGCNIRTRVGLHETSESACSPTGVILLEMVGEASICTELKNRLGAVEGVEVKEMIFEE